MKEKFNIKNALQSEYLKFNSTKKIKPIILEKAREKQKEIKANKALIFNLFGYSLNKFSKAAVITLIVASSLLSLKFSFINNGAPLIKGPQLVDTSHIGFDTSAVILLKNFN